MLCTVLVIGDITMKKACDICSYKLYSLKDLCLRHSRYSSKLVYQYIWIISLNGHSCSESKKKKKEREISLSFSQVNRRHIYVNKLGLRNVNSVITEIYTRFAGDTRRDAMKNSTWKSQE